MEEYNVNYKNDLRLVDHRFVDSRAYTAKLLRRACG
jgi:hypothetical protein